MNVYQLVDYKCYRNQDGDIIIKVPAFPHPSPLADGPYNKQIALFIFKTGSDSSTTLSEEIAVERGYVFEEISYSDICIHKK